MSALLHATLLAAALAAEPTAASPAPAATAEAAPAAVAEAPAPATTAAAPAAPAVEAAAVEEQEAVTSEAAGYTPPASTPTSPTQAFTLTGFVDVGFASAQGDGTSFAPGDNRFPADYGVDAFAPAVNSRGEVASTDSSGRFTNGFLPRSMGIGGRPSFMVNTLSADLRVAPPNTPLFFFARAQLLPRFSGSGDATRLFVEQAFARITPFESREFTLAVGKFDPVFGIEYLDNSANLRTGITPSLVSRYTTGQQLGAKAFFRQQIAPIWSALSLNVALTNNSSEIEALQPAEVSLSGMPVASARLGYELNLPGFQLKLGGSGLYGPRNDQRDPTVRQTAWGADARLYFMGVQLAGEYVALDQARGTSAEKLTATGEHALASAFTVRGLYAFAGWTLPFSWEALRKVTVYGRYGRRMAEFEGFTPITVDRITAGARIDLWDALALKGELLFNRELEGAPNVANDVRTFSLVYTW